VASQAEVLRLLHTVKGGARLAGLRSLGELAHTLESQAEALPPPGDAARSAAVIDLVRHIDRLQAEFEGLRLRLPASLAAPPVLAPALAVATPLAAPTGLAAPLSAVTALAVQGAAAPLSSVPADAHVALAPPGVAPGLALAPVEVPATEPGMGLARPGPGAGASGVVRVRAQLLDRLMNQAGEVMITGARVEAEITGLRGGLHELATSVERLRQQLREVEIQAETQMQSRQGHTPGAAGFDPLELDRFTRMQELTRSMAESVNDIATVQRQLARAVDVSEDDLSAQSRQTRDLQRDLLRTRMLEIGSIAERLRRTVRQAAQDSGKEVRLEIEGETLEVDRGMLDRMTPVFEHLLRNAVAHGIEPAFERQQAGKPACGLLRIVLEQAGNDIALRFEDDGAGLDLDRITAKARSQGLLADTPQALSPAAAADLIFRPGFSTAASVSELAGRGVGLDVVRAEVQALGGRIQVESRPGAGCTFRLLLPLTTAVTHVVLMRCGSMRFGVPASLVETVLRSEPQVLAAAQSGGQWPLEGGGSMPFFWGGALLRVSRASQESLSRAVPVALLQSAAQRLALQIDEVMGHREVVVKHLGPQLARLPGLAGMTVLATGEVILIYNPVALAAVYGDRARRFAAGEASGRDSGSASFAPGDGTSVASPGDAPQPSQLGQDANHGQIGEPPVAARQPLVLVVDDSLTVRRVTQRLLQREGYRVALAADGLQALERLAQEAPDLVLSDIEMPRMDGFELARHLRGDPRWSGLPLVFITSRTAPKHREHAQSLGVDHYLGKPYSEDELMDLVRRYCGGPTGGDPAGGDPAGEAGSPAQPTVA
jgi:chemosensory pili system protein ChpA (sensor histidine kinase/response regulator)